MEKEKVEKIVRKHRHEKAALLAILHDIQEEEKQLGMDSLRYVSELLRVPYARVYGLATFYSAFNTAARKGETEIRICDGICCHIRGSEDLISALKSRLDIDFEETSWSKKYSLEKVHCLGLCSIGPNVSFNAKTYSKVDREKMLRLLDEGGFQ